jgi:hypothetical protein
LVDLLIVSFEGRQFLLKIFLEKPALRWAAAGAFVLVGLATSAMADLTPYDPHALLATGGDATDICPPEQSCGQAIQLSAPGGGNQGGGIFVFTNNTGNPLSAVDVNITLPESFLDGFSFTGTIFTPGPGASSVSETILTHPCGDPSDKSNTSFCVEMAFAANPGPIVPLGGNFVLDFDAPTSQGPPPIYTGVDGLVATGNYSSDSCGEFELPNCTGTTDTSVFRVGEWADGAQGFVTPVVTPEPRYYAGFLALAIFFARRRSAVAR